MTTKLLLALKKWAAPIVGAYTILLTMASLMHLKDVPSLGSTFDDKIFHLMAYFIFTLLVFNYCASKNYANAILVSAIVTITYGIVIEVLQYVLTTHRTLDIYDIMANTLGTLLAVLALKYLIKTKVKMN